MAGTARMRSGRLISVVKNDDESELRTPAKPLLSIPTKARDAISAVPPYVFVQRAQCDLTHIAPGRPQAFGEIIEITGKIVDEDGRAVSDMLVEMWNANAHGRYSHSLDEANADAPLDPHFYGFGSLLTDSDGRYRLRTVKPGAYIARRDIQWWRPPHVHFSVIGGGLRLVTQMYFPGEPLNECDYIHRYIPQADRPRVIGTAEGKSAFRFDIILRGRLQTPRDTD